MAWESFETVVCGTLRTCRRALPVFVAVLAGSLWLSSFVGCDRPEMSRSEYGTFIEEFPKIQDMPATLPLPEGVEINKSNGVL